MIISTGTDRPADPGNLAYSHLLRDVVKAESIFIGATHQFKTLCTEFLGEARSQMTQPVGETRSLFPMLIDDGTCLNNPRGQSVGLTCTL